MPSIQVPIRKGTPSETFDSIPERYRVWLRDGLKAFSALSPSAQDAIVSFTKDAIRAGPGPYGKGSNELSSRIGISEDAASSASAIFSLALVILSAPAASVEQFVKAGVESKIVTEDLRQAATELAELAIADRETVRSDMQRAQLADATLPSLVGFYTSVDIRLAFDDESKVTDAVPVAVAHINDDGDGALSFQMTKQQVETMIKDLQELLRNLEQTEKAAQTMRGQER